MKSWLAAASLALLIAATCPPASAQTTSGTAGRAAVDGVAGPIAPAVVARDAQGQVTVRAVRINQPLTIDGQLDEEWYRTIPAIDGFVQSEPRENEPATEKTDAWIFFDDQNIYVAARCWDSQPKRIVANELRHDSAPMVNNDFFEVVFDTFHDRRNGVVFMVTPLGGLLEESFVDERTANRDWNVVWDGKAGRFDGGWTLEMVIPFKSLRYRPGIGQLWGLQFNRSVRWKNENSWLSLQARQYGRPPFHASVAATMVGIETPPLAKNIEIKPYAIAGVTTDRTARPAPIVNDPNADAGLDVKYGVTGSLTADFTYNTDFAQVEEDEQQVNLTRFNLLFPEKREFFLEGQGIFSFGGRSAGGGGTGAGSADQPILFFSRQIGISQARAVPIIGGGRLTGRAGAYNIGVVNIQTDDEPAAGAVKTNFTAIRVRRDILGRSNVGALLTNRSVALRGQGGSQTFGVDGVFPIHAAVRLDTYLARTQTPGLSGDDLSYRGALDYNADRYGATAEYLAVGDNFNPEVGFLRRRDFRKSEATFRFSPAAAPASRVRRYYYNGGLTYIADGTGRLETRDASANFRVEFDRGDNFNLDYDRNYERLDEPFRVAPGVIIPIGGYGFGLGAVSYQVGPQRRISGTFSMSSGSFYTGDQTAASYRGRVILGTRLQLEPAISFNWIDLPQGTFTTKLTSTRVTAPLTPRMFVSTLLQYNSSVNTFSINARLRWEYQPGSELFVVWTEGRNTLGTGYPSLETRGFVVKINRLFRL